MLESSGIWRVPLVASVSLLALGCLHGLLYQLHSILVPFVLSGFIVLALQPSVDFLHGLLAGRVPPYRWCICCKRRKTYSQECLLLDAEGQPSGRPGSCSPTARSDSASPRSNASCRAGDDPPSPRGRLDGGAAGFAQRGGPVAPRWGMREVIDLEKPEALPSLDPEAGDVRQSSKISMQTEATPLLSGRSRLGASSPEALSERFADELLRFLSVTIVLSSMLLAVLLTVELLCQGALHMKQNAEAYRAGLHRLQSITDRAIDRLSEEFHMTAILDQKIKEAYDTILSKAQDMVWVIVDTIATSLSEGLTSAAVMLLYVMFWLLQPLPTGGTVGALVRSYLYKKTLVSSLYGGCVACLFAALGVDLAILFGVISFFFNFVPEVGAFISMLTPIPVILLDGRISNPFLVLSLALVGQLVLKFVVGNVLEVKLVERDQEMSIHPVWVILGLSYFGFIWGPTGMLISVPILAMIKTAAISAQAWDNEEDATSATLAEGLLACLEGRARTSVGQQA